MERTYARFLTPVKDPDPKKTTIRVGGLTLQYIDYDEQTTALIKAEAAQYEIFTTEYYCYEYDEDDSPTRGVSHKYARVDKLASLSSMTYSTDEPQADLLIVGGSFVGTVLCCGRKGGNGWNNYDERWYCLLYTDGRIVGDNTYTYSFSGESSSKEYEYTYTLQQATH